MEIASKINVCVRSVVSFECTQNSCIVDRWHVHGKGVFLNRPRFGCNHAVIASTSLRSQLEQYIQSTKRNLTMLDVMMQAWLQCVCKDVASRSTFLLVVCPIQIILRSSWRPFMCLTGAGSKARCSHPSPHCSSHRLIVVSGCSSTSSSRGYGRPESSCRAPHRIEAGSSGYPAAFRDGWAVQVGYHTCYR